MDDNMNNKENENESGEAAFGSREYYKNLYGDLPEDVAEMLIGTHPLMKKEVSDELTHSIKIKSAREKNLRAVTETDGEADNEQEEHFEEEEIASASKDPVEDVVEPEDLHDYVGDITNFTKGLVTPSAKKQKSEAHHAVEETKYEEPKSDDDITAEKVAKMLGGVDVEPVDQDEFEEFEEVDERPRKKVRKEDRAERSSKPKRSHRQIDEKALELDNIEKQANLNELFREDDDYYEEKHSGNSVLRIVIIVAAVVVLAFFIYKVASLSGQVTKLNEQVTSYKTMEAEYEQLKLDNLSLTEQVENLQAQLGGNAGGDNNAAEPSDTNSNSGSNAQTTPANTNSGSKTYTVQAGDTFWGIATKMYGNGSYYDRILTANGLTENDKIREGMTLTIPAA